MGSDFLGIGETEHEENAKIERGNIAHPCNAPPNSHSRRSSHCHLRLGHDLHNVPNWKSWRIPFSSKRGLVQLIPDCNRHNKLRIK